MPISLDQIVEETRQLPADVVAKLVDRILVARHGGIEPAVEAAWQAEIERRVAQIEAGTAQGIPVEDSLARIRKIAGL
jgi:putative addiction module component (TIGR02574 family)